MAFVHRAQRDTAGAINATPSAVGPGVYHVEPTRRVEPGYAPFASTAARATAADAGNSASASTFTPGPGYYLRDTPVRQSDAGSNAFVTKVSRFQGLNKTAASTPGPGAYNAPGMKPKQARDTSPPGELRGSASAALYKHAPSAPSIPAPSQSYGYEEGPGGALIMQKSPHQGHKGTRDDIAGPGEYNPTHSVVLRSGRGTDFGRSTGKKDVFRNASPVPGPGEYTPSEVAGEGAVFASRSPHIAFNRSPQEADSSPGPGAYSGGQPLFKKALEKVPESLQFFGSTVKRSYEVEPQHYNAPFRYKTPGPGAYGDPKQALLERPVAPPFNSSTGRFGPDSAAERVAAVAAPGPGAYDEYDARGMASDVQRKVVGRNGAFGSTAKRDFARPVKPAAAVLLVRLEERPHVQDRPAKAAYEVPPPGAYDVVKSWDAAANKPYRQSNVFISAQSRFSGHNDPFATHAVAPGPGAYDGRSANPAALRQKHGSSVFVSKNDRFSNKVAPKPGRAPGPGQYHEEGSLVKRSFNVTIDW
eukprot:tig00000144_g9042.t1